MSAVRWVVIGAGTAGCVVAARLTERLDVEVILIEEGAAGGTTPPSVFDAIAEPGRLVDGPILRGRGLGGSSAINGMLATSDEASALGGRLALPFDNATEAERGPIDRALLAAASHAAPAPLTRRDGIRVTTADAYLDVAVRSRLELRRGVGVRRIVVEDGRSVGAELADGSAVAADRVVLAAGAIGSPILLLASGLGGDAVGTGLRNHPGLPITLHLRDGVEVDRHGLVTSATWRVEPDLEIVALNHLGPDRPGLAMLLVGVMAPTGVGSITVGPSGEAIVDLPCSDHDRDRLAVGRAHAERLLEHPSFAALVDRWEVGEPPAGFHHATSTCAIGEVVDERGRVAGVEGVWIIDASVFPTIPATHPYLPTVLLAERLATQL